MDDLDTIDNPDISDLQNSEDNIGLIEVNDEKQSVSIVQDLNDFFKSYLVETPDGFLQIFQSFTYGEMVISFLLLLLVMLFVFRWIWEVLR